MTFSLTGRLENERDTLTNELAGVDSSIEGTTASLEKQQANRDLILNKIGQYESAITLIAEAAGPVEPEPEPEPAPEPAPAEPAEPAEPLI